MRDAYLASLDGLVAAEQRRRAGRGRGSFTFKFDAALIDGRFRTSAALKLVPHLHKRSVLFIHDFWNRAAQYLEETSMFYDVIGRARSVVVLKLKPQLPRDWEAHRNTFIHQPEPKVW